MRGAPGKGLCHTEMFMSHRNHGARPKDACYRRDARNHGKGYSAHRSHRFFIGRYAQNLKKILMKILLTKTQKTLSTWLRLRLCCCSVMLRLASKLAA